MKKMLYVRHLSIAICKQHNSLYAPYIVIFLLFSITGAIIN